MINDNDFVPDPNQRLFVGIENSDLVAVREAFEAGADPNVCVSLNHRTSFHYAIKKLFAIASEMNENMDSIHSSRAIYKQDKQEMRRAFYIVYTILKQESLDINAMDRYGNTPLHYAVSSHFKIERGFVREIDESVIDQKRILYLDLFGQNLLNLIVHLLKDRNQPENKKINVDGPDREGKTALHWTAVRGNYWAAKILAEKNADLNSRDSKGRTPLFLAAYYGNLDVVQLLIEKGADINLANDDGETPLHAAAGEGNRQIVQWLILKGASPEQRIERGMYAGKTSIQLAEECDPMLARDMRLWSQLKQFIESQSLLERKNQPMQVRNDQKVSKQEKKNEMESKKLKDSKKKMDQSQDKGKAKSGGSDSEDQMLILPILMATDRMDYPDPVKLEWWSESDLEQWSEDDEDPRLNRLPKSDQKKQKQTNSEPTPTGDPYQDLSSLTTQDKQDLKSSSEKDPYQDLSSLTTQDKQDLKSSSKKDPYQDLSLFSTRSNLKGSKSGFDDDTKKDGDSLSSSGKNPIADSSSMSKAEKKKMKNKKNKRDNRKSSGRDIF